CLILEPRYMEGVLFAIHYPNLSELKIVHYDHDQMLTSYINNLSFRHILKQQITKLDLMYNCKTITPRSLKLIAKSVHAQILIDGERLQHLSVTSSTGLLYASLVLRYLPPTIFTSSTLTYLRINVQTFTDLLYLLDGRFKQLHTLIAHIYSMETDSSVVYNTDDLPNLKCFSFVYYYESPQYYNVLRHLCRMKNLEKLTLYIRIVFETTFIDPIDLINQFLMNASELQSFKFYLGTRSKRTDLIHYLSENDIKQNYMKNVKCQEISNFVQYNGDSGINHMFTLPFQFEYLQDVGNIFPDILFSNVVDLCVCDNTPFEHEFFQRISRSFPKLRALTVVNTKPWLYKTGVPSDNMIPSYEIVEYPHLSFLDISTVSNYYIEEFLNETKIRLSCLLELKIDYERLRVITKDFTRESTRHNCANVQRLIIYRAIVGSKDYYDYFPLL
ncbi:unnamed protein product, partial [Adineta ricciae]